MSAEDQLFTFINAQHETNKDVAASLGRIEQALKDNGQRLFGGDGQQGALPLLYSQFKEHEKKDDERFAAIQKPVESLLRTRIANRKWLAGVAAVLTLECTVFAFYIKYLLGPVSAFIAKIKVGP